MSEEGEEMENYHYLCDSLNIKSCVLSYNNMTASYYKYVSEII